MMVTDPYQTRKAVAVGDNEFGPGGLEHSLALGLRLVRAAEAFAAQFDAPELGDIDLPPALGSAADQASLRAVAPLYLAAELETSRLLPAVEMLAGLFVSGGIQSDLGTVAPKLAQFWRERRDRFSPEERRGFFSRLFGHAGGPPLASERGSNAQFENLFIDLTAALYKLDESPWLSGSSSQGLQARIRASAAALAGNLIPRSAGLTAVAARDVLETAQTALAFLKEPAVQHAVGATSVWLAVRNIAGRYLNEEPDIATHVARGKSGLVLLAWLAERLPEIESPGSALAATGDQTVQAAGMWLEASLSLHEQEAPDSNTGQQT